MLGEIKISIRAYSRQINVDEKAVRKAIADGKIKKGFDKKTKKITATIANKEWGFLHNTPKPQRGISTAKALEKIAAKSESKVDKKENKPDEVDDSLIESFTYEQLIEAIKIHPSLTYSEAIRRKEIINIANDKMKLEESNGLLVRKDVVNKSLFSLGDQLKKELLNMPARIIEDIRSAPTKVDAINIFTAELNETLTKISALALP